MVAAALVALVANILLDLVFFVLIRPDRMIEVRTESRSLHKFLLACFLLTPFDVIIECSSMRTETHQLFFPAVDASMPSEDISTYDFTANECPTVRADQSFKKEQ